MGQKVLEQAAHKNTARRRMHGAVAKGQGRKGCHEGNQHGAVNKLGGTALGKEAKKLIPGSMAAYHGQCIGCHKEKGGPVDACAQCHMK